MTVPESMQRDAGFDQGRSMDKTEPTTPITHRSMDNGSTPGSALRSPQLEGLDGHLDRLQLDAFNRARLSGGSKGLGKLLGFRSPKPAAPSPGTPEHLTLTPDDMLSFSEESLPTSLLKHTPDNASRAVKMFASILTFMGVHGETLPSVTSMDLIQKLLHQGLKRPELRDELYLQLVKQTRGCPPGAPLQRAWQLLLVCASVMPPSREFTALVSEYVHGAGKDEDGPEEVRGLASRAWDALKRTTKAGQRRTLPELSEIDGLLRGQRSSTVVYFLDDTFEEVEYDSATTVAEAVERVARLIKLEAYQTFTLFVVPKGARGAQGVGEEDGPAPVALDDGRYLADVLHELRGARGQAGGSPRLVFRKRMFRETDESVSEPRFVALSYIQAQADYVAGAYPVARDDAAQMAALALAAAGALEEAGTADGLDAALERVVPRAALASRPRDEWRKDVSARCRALAGGTRDDARAAFLRVIRSLPYGGASFFVVRRMEDPIGLLPAKLVLGINKRGVHFFRPVPKEYLHSAELRDIMQFGSSAAAVFFKMRVAGVLHVFQFETRAGEDICMALQTHINDVMMRRYAKVKDAPGAGDDAGQAAFGPKYQAHVAELQRQLDEAREALADRDARLADLASGAGGAAALADLDLSGVSDDERVAALQRLVQDKERERAVLAARVASLEAGVAGAAGGGADAALRERELKINELVEELGSKDLMLSAAQADLASAGGSREELAKLREGAADFERRERAQAEVVSQQARRLEELDRLYREESLARKKIHNAMEDLKGKIRVYCRVRPLLEFERQKGQAMAVDIPDELSISLQWMDKKREFNFDAVFPGSASQERVFADTQHLIRSAVDGYNVCIFAYGQTGSGKTFTIYGSDDSPGLAPRGVRELFDVVDRDSGKFSFKIDVFMLELYCDDLSDLLADHGSSGPSSARGPRKPSAKLEIKKDPKGVVTVPGAALVPVSSAAQLLRTIEHGLAGRRVSSTAMNRESSRSHLIITICIEATNLQTQAVTNGKLSFVDLAGSERVKKSKSEGDQLKEAQAINKSLSALGNVISALATEQGHVPYRDHKLTMLMSDSIGGTAKTLMFVNVSPVDGNLDETNNSLQYAQRVSTIRNDVGKNEASKDVVRLQRQVAHWKEQAGLPPHLRAYVDLVDIRDERQNGDQ